MAQLKKNTTIYVPSSLYKSWLYVLKAGALLTGNHKRIWMNCKVDTRILYFLNFYICRVQDISCTKHRVGEGFSHHVIWRCSWGFFLLCREMARDQPLGYVGMSYSINFLKLHSEVVFRKRINIGEKHWYPWIKGNGEEHIVIIRLL